MRRRISLLRLAPLAAAVLLTACSGTRKLVDPVVVITTRNGMELGVTTRSGVVFTGATAERGEIEIEAWFGDGPTIERTIIEPVSDELFTAEIDIVLPSVPISFDEPRDGESLQLMGRKDGARWSMSARAKTDPRVFGLLLEIPSGFPDDPDQVGAGVFRRLPEHRHELVGLVVGKVQLERSGSIERYLAVAGPTELWRLVAHRRDHLRKKPFVYREDIL
ncbi:MAG: hypothetical protein VXW31_09940 [Planctomycetota bacterium]|nr:hypothetical protein [Planctomycetota bacterium]